MFLPENDLYSATSMNFLGSEPIMMRSSSVPIRTEFKTSWLNGGMWPHTLFCQGVWYSNFNALLCHFLSLGQSPRLLPWPRCRRVREVLWGTMTRFTCSSVRRLWSATATTSLPSPGLPVFARWLSLLCILLFFLTVENPQCTVIWNEHFLLQSLPSFRSFIAHPVFVFKLSVRAHSGGCWRSAYLTKKVDVLPEGQTGLSGAGVSVALHHSGHLPLVWPPQQLEWLSVLQCVHTSVVSLNIIHNRTTCMRA